MAKKSGKKRKLRADEVVNTQIKLGELPRKRSDSYFEPYADHCEVIRTPNDFRIRFSRLSMGIDKGVVTHELEEQCMVLLASSQAKALSEALKRMVNEQDKK